ncbi:hypothetical protein [Paludisphaera mucosa]|uniref:Zinc finger/thioredoxin putative domain-containing protein n=1 Tax=Paludisphaera mucosa TaxID=3030827 RepID=A0ABT6F882_9BACT|nr:hypothetical protein [Paludisphaera mucosa]MDG3003803.1 hypothetical protein [Paludisphaera mucosa]
MSIVFFCSHCGARFEIGEQAAGKVGRCKRCGEKITVPPPAAVAAAAPARAPAAAVSEGGGPAWLAQVTSQVALAPLTMEGMPGLRKPKPKATPMDDDLGDSKPYAVVETWKVPATDIVPGGSRAAGEVKIAWRGWWGTIQKLFRRLNEFAYLLSVPFLILLLIGATMHNRGLALLGGEAVVLLNIGRVLTGLANILAVPFREGPATGLLFLFPPYTIKYMIDHWKRLKRPTQRVVTPLLTIGAVILAFTFLPSLSGGSDAKAEARPKSVILGR